MKEIGYSNFKTLEYLGKTPEEWIFTAQVKAHFTEIYDKVEGERYTYALKWLEKQGFLKRKPTEKKRQFAFIITKQGIKTLDIIKKGGIIVKERKQKTTKKPVKQAPLAPTQQNLNISITAETVVDQLSAVINENSKYRNILLDIHTLIENLLELKKDKVQE